MSLEQVLASLVASGPVALVLAIAVHVLWARLRELERECALERVRLEGKVDTLHTEHIQILRELSGAIRGDAADDKEGDRG